MKVVFLLFFSVSCFAQSGFYTKTIDFSNEANARWEHSPSDNLGTMLLDAHLRGELKAYRFALAHDVTKYAPIPAADLPSPWDPTADYYLDDMVSHNGKVYIARTDIARGSFKPDNSMYWQDMDMHGPAVSIHHHFPTDADTTTKSYLLTYLVEEEPAAYDPWSNGLEYFHDDRVVYGGKTYEARGNNFAGIIPGTNENFWMPIESRLVMYQPTDLNVIETLYHYKINDNDTIHTPQMVSVRVVDRYKEVYRNVGLNFFYNDVVRYLERSHQPALYLSDIGRLDGGAFLFDEHTKGDFTRWIHSKILSKEIKPGKKAILSDAEYNQFVSTKPEDLNVTSWYPVQNPATHDFTIVAGKLNADHEYYTIAALAVPYKSIEKLLKAMPPPPKPKAYKDIFTSSFLVSSIDTVAMDSIEALPLVSHPTGNFRETYFDEIHFDRINANPVVFNTISPLWELIAQALSAKTLKLHPSRSYYPCHYNWTDTEIVWSMGSQMADGNFSISHTTPAPAGLPMPEWKMKEAGIVYRINSSPSTSGKYRPVQLVISFEAEPHGDLVDYRVDWSDVMKLVGGKKEYADLTTGVEKATLNFKRTAISYNYLMAR
jgi:hypothetical protein